MFLEALFFAFKKNFFRVSVHNFGHCRLHEIIGLQLSQCLSANHNPESRCVFCTGVTLFAPVLHFLHWCYAWTALLSANQNRVIFSCVLLILKYSALIQDFGIPLQPFYCWMYLTWYCTDLTGVVVRALASDQCCPGVITRLGVICGLSLLVVYSALRGFFLSTPVYPSPQKPTFDEI